MNPLSVYIHIPFCRSKCAYCDFASYPGREDAWEAYFRALFAEIEAASDRERRVETIFFGGGTPSAVPFSFIGEALEAVARAFDVVPGAEITLEANPGTLTPEKLAAYRAMGVNRLSIGAQSFDAALLKDIGRVHTPEDIEAAVPLARAAGFENVGLDLMYALPGQTMRQWESTLRRAVELSPEHVSAYSLIVEENTPIAARASEIPGDDEVVEMQRLATATLEEEGYLRYEISNYAREGFRCRHNIAYWQRAEYLGFGAAAHSFLAGERFENPASLSEYLGGRRRENRKRILRAEAEEETILLSTRMTDGISRSAFRREFGKDFLAGREAVVKKLVGAGLAVLENDAFYLTGRGLELQSAAVLELL